MFLDGALPRQRFADFTIPAVADWTVILTSVGAALVSGGFGYAAASRAANTTIRQIEAENERLRVQHREEHLRNRQGTYHEFLNLDRRFTSGILRGETSMDTFLQLHDASMGVILFGSAEARSAMETLVESYGQLFRDAAKRSGNESGPVAPEQLRAAWVANSAALNSDKKAVLDAMREDVAPRPAEAESPGGS